MMTKPPPLSENSKTAPPDFKQHDNRKQAQDLAEFITPPSLCRLIAEKVQHYLGRQAISVIDGASGSGQLQRFLTLKDFWAIDVQPAACAALKTNYPTAHAHCMSFFAYEHAGELADCAIMNPPFSLKYKDLPASDKAALAKEFPKKKSGVLDDVFLLKALGLCKRFAIFICFPGIAYRQTEKSLRLSIGVQLVECNKISNAFEHTTIDVLLLVIDKEKTGSEYTSTHKDMKSGEQFSTCFSISGAGEPWQLAQIPEPPPPPIDIDALNREILESTAAQLRASLELDAFLQPMTGIDFYAHCGRLMTIIKQAQAAFIAQSCTKGQSL